jgi:tetratricopeptide (TPR) repeat protein
MGRLEEAKQAYAEAIAESRARVRHIRTGQAMVKLAFTLRDLGEVASARSYLAQAVQLLEREPPGPELVLAYTHTARDHIFSGRYRDCLEWSARAIALARDLGIEGQAMRALQYLGLARFDSGDVDGIEDVREALRMGLDLGLGEETAVAYINLGELVWFTEGPAQALEIYETGIDFTERRGITFRAMWLKAQTVWALFELGRWGEVVRTTDELIEWESTRGGSQVGTIALPFKARVLMWRNALTEAASLMEETLARARDIGDPHVLAPALASAALVQQARGENSDAVRLIEELEAGTPDRSIERVRCSLDALRVCLAAGEIDVAKAMLQGSTAETARSRLSAITGRAILAEDRREFDDATGLYLEAEEGWRVYGHTFERGQALLGAGRCLLGHERAYEATKTLKVARGVFEWLGARRLVAEADRLLERAQKDARPRPGG